MRNGGHALLDLGRPLNQNFGPGGLFASSAILSSEAKVDLLLAQKGRHAALVPRLHSADEMAVLSRIKNPKRAVPLEVALGDVIVSAPDAMDSASCKPAMCSQQPACGLPGGTPRPTVFEGGRRHFCVISYLFGAGIEPKSTNRYHNGEMMVLLVHKFAHKESGCLATARELPLVRELLRQVPGRFVPEVHHESRMIADKLRMHGDELRRTYLKSAGFDSSNVTKAHAKPKAVPLLLETEQLNANGVRLWYREPKSCHASTVSGRHGAAHRQAGADPVCPEWAQRFSWSNLHTFQASG